MIQDFIDTIGTDILKEFLRDSSNAYVVGIVLDGLAKYYMKDILSETVEVYNSRYGTDCLSIEDVIKHDLDNWKIDCGWVRFHIEDEVITDNLVKFYKDVDNYYRSHVTIGSLTLGTQSTTIQLMAHDALSKILLRDFGLDTKSLVILD